MPSLPPVDADATKHIPALCESTRKNCLIPFEKLIANLNGTFSSNVPPVIVDFTLIASELGILLL